MPRPIVPGSGCIIIGIWR